MWFYLLHMDSETLVEGNMELIMFHLHNTKDKHRLVVVYCNNIFNVCVCTFVRPAEELAFFTSR